VGIDLHHPRDLRRAFFASFPLFYSTSFGGAYWVWVLLLVTFVFQAVSYEFAYKKKTCWAPSSSVSPFLPMVFWRRSS
jgi:Cytochrome bd-type quinol oxidase, subunit 2